MAKIEIRMTLMSPQGKLTPGICKIDDEIAVSTFADKYLAKRLSEVEIKAGNNNVSYNNQYNAIVEKYPGKDAEQIYNKIKKELTKAGGKMLQRRDDGSLSV